MHLMRQHMLSKLLFPMNIDCRPSLYVLCIVLTGLLKLSYLLFPNWRKSTLDSEIDIGVRLLSFGPGATFLITDGNAYVFSSKYPLFDGMGNAYFKGYA